MLFTHTIQDDHNSKKEGSHVPKPRFSLIPIWPGKWKYCRLYHRIFLTLILSYFFLFSSCAPTYWGTPAERCDVKTVPPGADIYLNGNFVGKSPVSVYLDEHVSRRFVIKAEKEGYESSSIVLADHGLVDDFQNKVSINLRPIGFSEKTSRLASPKPGEIGSQQKLAILDFEEIGPKARQMEYGKAVARMLTSMLVGSGHFIVVERAKLKRVFQEHTLSQSDIIEDPGKLPRISGVNLMIIGSVAAYETIEIDMRMIDVGRAITILAENARCSHPDNLRDAVKNLATKVVKSEDNMKH